jgi:hypothetical protein
VEVSSEVLCPVSKPVTTLDDFYISEDVDEELFGRVTNHYRFEKVHEPYMLVIIHSY